MQAFSFGSRPAKVLFRPHSAISGVPVHIPPLREAAMKFRKFNMSPVVKSICAVPVAFIFSLVLAAPQASGDTIRLVIFAGQSNIGTATSSPESVEIPKVMYQYNTRRSLTDDWGILRTTGANNVHASELTFGEQTSSERPGDHFAFIKFSRGGTNLRRQWHPDTEDDLYDEFMDFTTHTISQLTDAGHTVKPAAFVWVHGSGDGGQLAAARAYRDNLADLAAAVRSDLGVPRLPMIINQFHGFIF